MTDSERDKQIAGVVWNHLGINDPSALDEWFAQVRAAAASISELETEIGKVAAAVGVAPT